MNDSVCKKDIVFSWLIEMSCELEHICKSNIGAKYKVMLLMTYVDIFSQVWDIAQDLNAATQKARFKNWASKFATQQALDKKVGTNTLSAENVYDIRNALLHYAGLPKSNIGIFISELSSTELCKKYNEIEGLESSITLSPKVLFPAYIEAFGKTIESIAAIENNQPKFSDLINKLYSKLEKNCALPIRT